MDRLHGARCSPRSPSDAGSRYVDLRPVLRDELSAHKAASADTAPNAYVFPSAAGTRQDGNRVRSRVLAKAVDWADKQLTADGQTALPEGLTLHALRPGDDRERLRLLAEGDKLTDNGSTPGAEQSRIRPGLQLNSL